MSQIEKKRKSILNSSLLQSITQTFAQTIPTVVSPSEQLANLSVVTPTSTTSQNTPQIQANESTESLERIETNTAEQMPLMVLKQEFESPTPTPKRSSNFLKGCKW